MKLLRTGIFLLLAALHPDKVKSQNYNYERLFEKNKTSGVQKEDRKRNTGEYDPYILLSLNAAIPLGDYGSSNLMDETPAFAKAGFDVHLNAAFPLCNFIYSTTTFGFIKNKPRLDDLTSLYNKLFSFNGYNLLDYEYNGYSHIFLASGFLITGRVDFISFDLRTQLGASLGIDGEQNFHFTDGTYHYYAVSEKATSISFLVSAGSSIRVKLNESFLLSVNCDYRHAKYHFNDVKTTVNGFSSGSDDYELKMDVISFGGGIGFTF